MFKLSTEYSPTGDQPEAIEKLVSGINQDKPYQVLLGVTGSGKTFTMANIIKDLGRPALILAHNKTLAAQLYQEFKTFFPENAVEYFVSYYDYYQPEAYIPRTDLYIEKDLAINDQIDKMRIAATHSLLEREDVIIVSSVSCIYGLGLPEYFVQMRLELKVGQIINRDDVLLQLVGMQYKRSDYDLGRSNFRVRGDVVEIIPAYEDELGFRIEFFGDEIERLSKIDPLTGKVVERVKQFRLYPASHHVTPEEARENALLTIGDELHERLDRFTGENKLVEKQRLEQRTRYDVEMIKEIGFCKGIENYSRHFSKRAPGDPPPCLLDYFPKDFLMFIDESHQTLPQVRAMYNGDKARKEALVEYGFRLPSAFDNRPLKFEEFFSRIGQTIFVSATPGDFEVELSRGEIVSQIIRPTGLLDPIIEVKPATNQVDDALEQIQRERELGGRVLVTTLTKKLSEDLSKYLEEVGVSAKYLHSDIDTLERVQIIKELREGVFDVLVGINLLREGLDIPEVSLVLILDADKEGFLRSETALVQTFGRAARNERGRAVLYADNKTKSIVNAIETTTKRRKIQNEYNKKHGITPKTTVRKTSEDLLESYFGVQRSKEKTTTKAKERLITAKEIKQKIAEYEKLMKQAAKDLNFEEAANYRDMMKHYKELELLEDHPI